MRFCAQTTLCLLTILIAAKSTIISINIFDVSKGGEGGLERNVKLTFLVGKVDMCGFPDQQSYLTPFNRNDSSHWKLLETIFSKIMALQECEFS